MKKLQSRIKDQVFDHVFLKLLFGNSGPTVTDEEVAYFRKHPEEIDEFAAPVTIHTYFLWFGLFAGLLLVGFSKILKYFSWLNRLSVILQEIIVDIVFEIGVALVGAAVTAYLMGVLLNQQQRNAKKWRIELMKRINQSSD